MLYPVNSVAWSLALELLVNAVYAFAWKPLKDVRILAATLAVSAAALVYACWYWSKLDIGFMWRDWLGGLPRVAFSFTAGLAVYRLYKSGLRRPRLPAWALVAVLPPLMWVKLDDTVYPLVCVLAVFPLMVFAAAEARPGARSASLFERLGAISYPLYALHKPAGELFTFAIRHTAPELERLGPWIGAPFVAALMGVCVLVERYYDGPFRRLLMAGLDDLFEGAGRLRAAVVAARARA
jgi:peptidoglycan/LPS O-acetylase OafA/YrhL